MKPGAPQNFLALHFCEALAVECNGHKLLILSMNAIVILLFILL